MIVIGLDQQYAALIRLPPVAPPPTGSRHTTVPCRLIGRNTLQNQYIRTLPAVHARRERGKRKEEAGTQASQGTGQRSEPL
jgi:hypothetical protein